MLKRLNRFFILLAILPCLFIFTGCNKNKSTPPPATSYTITYMLNGGTNNPENPTSYTISNATSIILKSATKDNYDFVGWYLDEACTQFVTTILAGSGGNVTLYAKWNPTNFNINYVLNNGTNSAGNPNTYNIESSKITLNRATRDGYDFVGWYSDENFETQVTEIATGSIGEKTFYAKWTPVNYGIE